MALVHQQNTVAMPVSPVETNGSSQPETTTTAQPPPPPPVPSSNPPRLVGPLSSPKETRIVYHVDDEETPYLVKLPIPHNEITLNDFKAAIPLPRPHYKFFFKSYDKDFGVVKEEIVDDNTLLPIFKDRVVAWLVSTEGSTVSDSTNSQCPTEIINGGGERHALVGDSHPPSFLGGGGTTTDHCGDTTTETESMISSRRGGHYLNHRHRMYGKHGNHGYGKYSGNRYHGNGHHHHHHHNHYMDSSVVTSDMESTSFVDSDDDDDDDDDFLDTGVDDDNDYDDYNSRISTTTEETSVSRQYARRNRRQRRHKGYSHRNMSRTSSLSSITESSMSLNVIQVILNLDTVNFLGISLVGQTSKKGDGGIYVSSIMKGGAVDLDGRIEPGDMILQVNDVNFERLTNDEAVQVIRDAVKNPGPIKLLVAKCWDPHPKGHFTIPRSEPVRPIDPGAWVAHTEAARAKFTNPDNFPFNPVSVSNFSQTASLPDNDRSSFQPQPTGMPPPPLSSFTSSTNTYNSSVMDANSLITGSPLRSSFKVGPNVTIAPTAATTIQIPPTLTVESSLETVAFAMASPNSGLDVRDRMWLKIRIPNAFLGSDVVDWLFSMVQGFHERKDAKKFASKLLKANYIRHTINLKSSFSEKCYYVFSEQLQELNKSSGGGGSDSCAGEFGMQPTQQLGQGFEANFSNALRLTNDNFQPNTDQSNFSSHFEYPANTNQTGGSGFNQPKEGKYKIPFMRYWDEHSEIQNYGLFGPQPVTAEINTLNDAMSSNSGVMTGHSHDPYQSDEQMSQRSGQSILYNPKAPGPMMLNSNTMASSNSNGSANTASTNKQSKQSVCSTGNNGNLINHHYEDLQLNPVTGNLVPSNGLTDYHQQYSQHTTAGGGGGMFTFRQLNCEETAIIEGNNEMKRGSTTGTISSSGSHEGRNKDKSKKVAAFDQSSLKRNGSGRAQQAVNAIRSSFRKAMGN